MLTCCRTYAGRYTKYVPYDDNVTFSGNWTADVGPGELYDYNEDPHETTNFVNNPSYAPLVERFEAALRKQYDPQS